MHAGLWCLSHPTVRASLRCLSSQPFVLVFDASVALPLSLLVGPSVTLLCALGFFSISGTYGPITLPVTLTSERRGTLPLATVTALPFLELRDH